MTFGSVYEILDPLTVIRKQRFWDWFDGNALKAFWNTTVIGGSPTFVMDDEVDGGLVIGGSAGADEGSLNFNNIRHYAHDASVFLAIAKTSHSTSLITGIGLSDATDFIESTDDYIQIQQRPGTGDFELRTSDGASGTSSSISAIDTNPHIWKGELTSSLATAFKDGILEASHSTNLPDTALQPLLHVDVNTASLRETNIRYFEAFNT